MVEVLEISLRYELKFLVFILYVNNVLKPYSEFCSIFPFKLNTATYLFNKNGYNLESKESMFLKSISLGKPATLFFYDQYKL